MDSVLKFIEVPLVQVLAGALISAWVALAVAKRGLQAQSRQAKLEFLTRIDRDILNMLAVFEPIPYHVDGQSRLTEGPGQLDNFKTLRTMYFKHSVLIDPGVRAELDQSFVRAETAYLLLLAQNETPEFKQTLVEIAELQGAQAADLLNMPGTELRTQMTQFCAELRSTLMELRDQTVGRIRADLM